MSKERYVEHTVAWELPNRDSVTKGNYNLSDIGTKYIPIQTEIVSDSKDQTINELQQRIAELEEQLKNATKQVRKEVCEEIRSRFLATCQIEKGFDTASFSLEVLNRILDQIEKGEI